MVPVQAQSELPSLVKRFRAASGRFAGLVLGSAAGYIGSVSVERLKAKGEPVVVLDDLGCGHRESCSTAREGSVKR